MTQYESQYERMIKQPIPSLILTLALPTTISMLVTNIYNIADTYFVSTVGTSATGAVGIVSYYRTRSYSSNNSSFLFYLEVISYH